MTGEITAELAIGLAQQGLLAVNIPLTEKYGESYTRQNWRLPQKPGPGPGPGQGELAPLGALAQSQFVQQ
jgi:hypothetical protein